MKLSRTLIIQFIKEAALTLQICCTSKVFREQTVVKKQKKTEPKYNEWSKVHAPVNRTSRVYFVQVDVGI